MQINQVNLKLNWKSRKRSPIIYLLKVVRILIGIPMVTVMISTILKPVSSMVEIAVDHMLIQHTAQNANALKEEGAVVELQHLNE